MSNEGGSGGRRVMAGDSGEGAGLVVIREVPFNAESPLGALVGAWTPTEQFYVRSNFAVPALDPAIWRLQVDGAVDAPGAWTLAELQAAPPRTLPATMECAGNDRTGFAPLPSGEPWGSGAISTGVWGGVPLATVLERAGLGPDVVEILFTGADGGPVDGHPEYTPFARSLPLAKALDPDTLLVYAMNGAPLPPAHGGPLRLLVPDWYGVASVKWVTRITALTTPFTGHFQAERYVMDWPGGGDPVPLQTVVVKSLISDPLPGSVLPLGTYNLRGVAWSGYGAIDQVEVSVAGGAAWQPATLVGEATPHAWQPWTFAWTPSRPGRHVLRVRATDAAGNRQPELAAWNRLGYANNAIQTLLVTVVDRTP